MARSTADEWVEWKADQKAVQTAVMTDHMKAAKWVAQKAGWREILRVVF